MIVFEQEFALTADAIPAIAETARIGARIVSAHANLGSVAALETALAARGLVLSQTTSQTWRVRTAGE